MQMLSVGGQVKDVMASEAAALRAALLDALRAEREGHAAAKPESGVFHARRSARRHSLSLSLYVANRALKSHLYHHSLAALPLPLFFKAEMYRPVVLSLVDFGSGEGQRPTTVYDFQFRWCLRVVETVSRLWTIESVLESHVTCASLLNCPKWSKSDILETYHSSSSHEMQIAYLSVGGRRRPVPRRVLPHRSGAPTVRRRLPRGHAARRGVRGLERRFARLPAQARSTGAASGPFRGNSLKIPCCAL